MRRVSSYSRKIPPNFQTATPCKQPPPLGAFPPSAARKPWLRATSHWGSNRLLRHNHGVNPSTTSMSRRVSGSSCFTRVLSLRRSSSSAFGSPLPSPLPRDDSSESKCSLGTKPCQFEVPRIHLFEGIPADGHINKGFFAEAFRSPAEMKDLPYLTAFSSFRLILDRILSSELRLRRKEQPAHSTEFHFAVRKSPRSCLRALQAPTPFPRRLAMVRIVSPSLIASWSL